MAKKVTGELYWELDGKLWEIKRQIRQKGGYPFDPNLLNVWLQMAIDGQFVFGEPATISSLTFDPVTYIGKNWKEEPDSDPGSKGLKEIKISDLRFETCLEKGEDLITGEEKIRRLKAKQELVRMGAEYAVWLLEDWKSKRENSVLEHLFRTRKVAYIDFPGTILRGPDGNRDIFYLYRDGRGKWDWYCIWLGDDWDSGVFSLCSASS